MSWPMYFLAMIWSASFLLSVRDIRGSSTRYIHAHAYIHTFIHSPKMYIHLSIYLCYRVNIPAFRNLCMWWWLISDKEIQNVEYHWRKVELTCHSKSKNAVDIRYSGDLGDSNSTITYNSNSTWSYIHTCINLTSFIHLQRKQTWALNFKILQTVLKGSHRGTVSEYKILHTLLWTSSKRPCQWTRIQYWTATWIQPYPWCSSSQAKPDSWALGCQTT